ncbi:unnamed protein product [Amoebophrya sp. A120]|nr:unnamed protein product [Amoebophrya sp. A120]|eukprot:GSA120T00021871001.1
MIVSYLFALQLNIKCHAVSFRGKVNPCRRRQDAPPASTGDHDPLARERQSPPPRAGEEPEP